MCVAITKSKKGESFLTPPFLHWLKRLNLELISPVQIAIDPLAAPADSAGRTAASTTEVLLHGGRQVGSIVPQ